MITPASNGLLVDFRQVLAFLLILLRMTGMLVFNPILGRRGIPVMVNASLAFILALLLVDVVPQPEMATPGLLVFLYWVVKELLVGLIAGFILRMFVSVLIVSGEMVDMQMGISMAKAFDPGSNASISMSAQYFNIMFTMLFFISNSHLTLIQITARSFEVLPLGSYLINIDTMYLIPQIFSNVLLLAAKLSIPICAIEIIVTFAVGIIMRIIPQINVFVVNIQFKLLVGFFVMLMLVPSYSAFMENLIAICVENIQTVWLQLAR